MSTSAPSSLIQTIASLQNQKVFAELSWHGNFEEYLAIVRQNPSVTRTAFQRVYDMILSYGQEEYLDNKKRLMRFNFFKDAISRARGQGRRGPPRKVRAPWAGCWLTASRG